MNKCDMRRPNSKDKGPKMEEEPNKRQGQKQRQQLDLLRGLRIMSLTWQLMENDSRKW